MIDKFYMLCREDSDILIESPYFVEIKEPVTVMIYKGFHLLVHTFTNNKGITDWRVTEMITGMMVTQDWGSKPIAKAKVKEKIDGLSPAFINERIYHCIGKYGASPAFWNITRLIHDQG